MVSFDLVLLTQAVGFGVCLWLGLYLFVRSASRTPLIVVGIVALLAQATFFGSSMLTFNVRDLPTLTRLERSFWWAAVLPSAAWFHFSDLVARQTDSVQRSSRRVLSPLVIAVYLAALLIIALGTTTNYFIDYAAPIVAAGERYAYLDRGVAYPAQIAFLILTGLGALLNLVRALVRYGRRAEATDRALAQQLRLLVGGALLFLFGAIYISSRFNWNPAVSVLPGYLCLFVGLGVLSYGIANFGLLLEGKDIRRDFFYNLTGIGLINVLYIGALLVSEAIEVRSLLLLVGLVTLTHMSVDSGRYLLDALFFSRAEREARAEARDYANDLGTQPVAPPASLSVAEAPSQVVEPIESAEPPSDAAHDAITSEKQFRSAVRRGLTSLKSPPQLAKSPLLTLDLVQRRVAQAGLEDNRLNRVAMLRELLIEQIDGLRPKDDESAKTGDAWRFYNVLYYPYVRELSRKAALAEARRLEKERQRNGQRDPGELEHVLHWLADVDEDTFYKWQRRASDTIATTLWEENAKLSA